MSDTLPEEWSYQTLVKSGVIKPSDGVVAGYAICVIYVFVITIIWSFRKKQKDGDQSTPVTSVPEEVSCERKKCKKKILWNIVTMIIGVVMYQVLFWRSGVDERMQDDTVESFGIFGVVTTVTL